MNVGISFQNTFQNSESDEGDRPEKMGLDRSWRNMFFFAEDKKDSIARKTEKT